MQKQGALEKAQRELENVEDKIGETASALKSAEKGREDTVSSLLPICRADMTGGTTEAPLSSSGSASRVGEAQRGAGCFWRGGSGQV